MSDQQQASLHKWEIVSQGERGENATTLSNACARRVAVPLPAEHHEPALEHGVCARSGRRG